MSSLAAAYIRRQPRRSFSITSTVSTVSSETGEVLASSPARSNNVTTPNNQRRNQPGFMGGQPMSMMINRSNDVNVTNVFNYNIIQSKDSDNPAFVLSDLKLTFRKKLLFALSQRWCLGLMFLIILLVTISNTLLIVIKPRTQVKIITRYGWNAETSKGNITSLGLPVGRIIVSHTNDEASSCHSMDECGWRLRALQQKYFELGYDDIPWNFMIGEDGNVYEGRGFELQGQASRNGSVISTFDDVGMYVAFVGTFNDNPPSLELVMTFQAFLDHSIRRDFIIQNYTLLLEDQLLQTEPFANGLFEALNDTAKFYQMHPVITRVDWGAQMFKDEDALEFYDSQIRFVIGRQLDVPGVCSDRDECIAVILSQQQLDFDQGRNDVKFNFFIGEFDIFEGRGWNVNPDVDRGNLSIGFLTDRLNLDDNSPMLNLRNKILDDGKMIGKFPDNVRFMCTLSLCGIPT